MTRLLLTALAAIAAALGILMDNLWLLVAAGVLFLAAVLTIVWLAAKRRRRRRGPSEYDGPNSREEELRSLGISDIRPKGAATGAPPPVEDDGADDEPDDVEV
ncbi:MAG: hypothetical protein R3362_08035, partial [Rhodothermales bacterium]|nr:hypothetical protein [Rhodothermales bacterium]